MGKKKALRKDWVLRAFLNVPSYVFCPEPVCVGIFKSQRSVKIFGRKIIGNYLQIGSFCAFGDSGFQDFLADGTAQMLTAVSGVHVDRIEADVIPVQNSKPDCANLSIDGDGGDNGLFGNGGVHGGDNAPVDGVGGVFQVEKRLQPLRCDLG